MSEIIGFENIATHIKNDLDSDKDVLLYAFNATGKTRLSCTFENDENIESLSYNAIVEDYFTWDNEEKIMSILTNTWLFNFIKDEYLEKDILFYFNKFTDVKIEPLIDFDTGNVQFLLPDENGNRIAVKISKGEETLFKWSVFYAALKQAVDILSEKQEDRSTDEFNNLKYIIIDDPMSSLDEFKIYTLSMQLIGLIQYVHSKNINVKFLITTHHVMFYNILFNTLKNRNSKCLFYIMQNIDQNIYLKNLGTSTPISYHLKSLAEIKKAFNTNTIRKNHFNIFRSVIEKSSIFLGYSNWQDLFANYDHKEDLNKIVNMNSHERYMDLETEYLTNEQINIFKDGFDYFINTYKIKL